MPEWGTKCTRKSIFLSLDQLCHPLLVLKICPDQMSVRQTANLVKSIEVITLLICNSIGAILFAIITVHTSGVNKLGQGGGQLPPRLKSPPPRIFETDKSRR